MRCYSCGKEMQCAEVPSPQDPLAAWIRDGVFSREIPPGREQLEHAYHPSGLDNVYLLGVPVFRCQCGEVVWEIPRMKRLHEVLAEAIAMKPAPLSGQEVRYLRKSLGFKAVDLAKYLGVTKSTVSRWENEEKRVGQANDRLIRLIFGALRHPAKAETYLHKLPEIESRRRQKVRIFVRRVNEDYRAEYVLGQKLWVQPSRPPVEQLG